MHKQKHEQGNAVTLTLLGLSIAILAGVVVLYFVGKKAPEQVYVTSSPVDESVSTEEDMVEEVEVSQKGWNTYVNDEYNFSMEYPDGWVVATGTLSTGDPAITFVQATQVIATSTPVYSHQDAVAHVSVYPLGVATEGIISESALSDVTLLVSHASVQDYILTSGRPWATKAAFEASPNSWNESGFVFARVVVEEEMLSYMRGDTEIERYEFDPVTGDHIERAGFVDTNVRDIEESMLLSFRFLGGDGEAYQAKESIVLEEPLQGAIVSSPQTIKGAIPGGWYFGEEYPITLQTTDGEVLAELFVTGLEEWDSQASIPFEVSLVFETPTATSGVLIIGEDAEMGRKLLMPVKFDN